MFAKTHPPLLLLLHLTPHHPPACLPLQIGSIFEYTGQRAILDIIQPDSPLYAPILGFFAVTGLPTAGVLFLKSVQAANKEAERMDKLDGY